MTPLRQTWTTYKPKQKREIRNWKLQIMLIVSIVKNATTIPLYTQLHCLLPRKKCCRKIKVIFHKSRDQIQPKKWHVCVKEINNKQEWFCKKQQKIDLKWALALLCSLLFTCFPYFLEFPLNHSMFWSGFVNMNAPNSSKTYW